MTDGQGQGDVDKICTGDGSDESNVQDGDNNDIVWQFVGTGPHDDTITLDIMPNDSVGAYETICPLSDP